ncbi:threonine/serine dehydratase [Peribacillus saganii]|uniref:threonine ammonia-lyase n=1 Tax=Peribacillus saganii TaxID=2303992 RepID=A0A372LJ42_9BACI|nr:threonine/serine dehydratase [Peribacillus saganii]RFU66402.1 threonine/serine dehydratase [Peribacillus saganii]
MNHTTITLQEIIQAHQRIKNYIRHTPLEYNVEFSRLYGAEVYLKLENLQVTGSFKPRGSFNKLLALSHTERKRGVIAPSAGNHGIGLAYAANQLKVPAHVYLPNEADPSKINALESYGAAITFFESIADARLAAVKDAQEKGYTFLSAYNDRSVVAAGGTVELEILDDLSDVEVVITCLGGGGLTPGICVALKSINPKLEVWGVQTKNSPTFAVWFQHAKTVPVNLKPSIAEGLSGPIEHHTMTFPIIQEHIDRIITVTDEEIMEAMTTMPNYQYIIEPSGAAGLASLKQNGGELKGRKAAIVVTGRNISWTRFSSFISNRVSYAKQ